MKKLAVILAFLLLGLCNVVYSLPVAAATNPFSGIQCNGAAASSPVCHAPTSDPITGSNGVVVKITRLIALAAGFAAILIIIIGGIMYITSGGDSSKTNQAREAIIYATVGLVVIVISQAIITFIVSRV